MSERDEELVKLVKPLIKWLNDHGHPYNKILIDNESAELVEVHARFNTTEFWRD